MNLVNLIREAPINIRLAYPIVLGQLAHVLVATADNLMVGRLGEVQLAAVSLGNTFVFLAMSVGIGFSFAITPLIAEKTVTDDHLSIARYAQHGLLGCTMLGIVLAVLVIVAEPLMYALDQPAEVVTIAVPYMRIIAVSLIPLMAFQAVKQYCDGMSETRLPMIAAVLANLINVAINYFLIFGKWGFPRLEVEGAGYGTLISRGVMVMLLMVTLSRKPNLKMHYTKIQTYSRNTISKLLAIGTPTALQMFFEISLFTAAIFLSGMIGASSQAANQIALNLSSLTFMFGVGLGATATIRVGNQLGLKNYKRLNTIVRSILLMTLAMELVFMLVFIIGRYYLPALYVPDQYVIEIAARVLLIAGLFQISDGLQVALLGVLRGLQDVWIPSLICFVSYWLVGLPISYILGIDSSLGTVGIWIGLLSALSVSSLLLFSRYRNRYNRVKQITIV